MSEPTVPESDYLHMEAEVERLTAELEDRSEVLDTHIKIGLMLMRLVFDMKKLPDQIKDEGAPSSSTEWEDWCDCLDEVAVRMEALHQATIDGDNGDATYGSEVLRLTAELATARAGMELAYAETDRFRAIATESLAREKALRGVLNEAFRTETVRDLHDWLERAKKGTVA